MGYTFYVDESGNVGKAAGQSNGFVFGGFVLADNDISRASDIWKAIKRDYCTDENSELKWQHFFTNRAGNPLKDTNPDKAKLAAIDVSRRLLNGNLLIPNLAVIAKDRLTKNAVATSKQGNSKIDMESLWVAPFGRLGQFLGKKGLRGKIVHDALSGNKEENERQSSWASLRKAIQASQPQMWNSSIQHIDEQIQFVNSSTNEMIQIADCICGIAYSARIGNEVFLRQVFNVYDEAGKIHGLGIIHLED
jgi:hypothetical protein